MLQSLRFLTSIGFFPLCDSPEGFRGLENVTSIDIGLSSKWVKLTFLVNYTFKGVGGRCISLFCPVSPGCLFYFMYNVKCAAVCLINRIFSLSFSCVDELKFKKLRYSFML